MSRHRPGPFHLGVRDIAHLPGEMREHELRTALKERWGEGIISVPEGAEVLIDVRLESVHEGILASGIADTVAEGECGRCLTEIVQPVEVEFQELFAYPGEEANDFEVQDDHVDLETLVRDAIVLSLPFQPICRPDCPGLDPSTGERLADSEGADPAGIGDPRWAALKGLRTDVGAADGPGAKN